MFKMGQVGKLEASIHGRAMTKFIDFSAKELIRLQEEKKASLLAISAEKDRCRREATESGKRQADIRRLKQHEDVHKQVIPLFFN
jgi:hypothetical protein